MVKNEHIKKSWRFSYYLLSISCSALAFTLFISRSIKRIPMKCVIFCIELMTNFCMLRTSIQYFISVWTVSSHLRCKLINTKINKCQTEFILPKKVKSNKQILCDKRKIFGNNIDYIYMRWSRLFFLSHSLYRFIFGHWFAWNGFFSFPIWNCCVVCAYFFMWFLYTLTLLTDKMRSRVSQSALSVCFFSLAQFLAIDFVRWTIFGTRDFLVNWKWFECMRCAGVHFIALSLDDYGVSTIYLR